MASSDWWYFYAWDSLSCGDEPQNGQLLTATEGTGNQTCISLDKGQKAYSYASEIGQDETRVCGYLYEQCEGPSEVLTNSTCTNPSVDVPFIRSWKVFTNDRDE